MGRFTNEEIEKTLKEYMSYVDYEVGDWVETCHFMPAIVQKINVRYNDDPNYDCFEDEVEVFYPHYAMSEKVNPNHTYHGGSCCSVKHCGVHKITPQYACKLMAIGEERLNRLWDKATKEVGEGEHKTWSEFVEEEYDRLFPNKE
jgi:hypothetical protein